MSEVFFCRLCGQAWEGGELGMACPNQDSGALIPYDLAEANPDDPMLGRMLGEKYAVVGFVGEGGFGAVYLAIQQPVGRRVALKVIAGEGHDAAQLNQFFAEAQIVAALSDPATVTLHDYGEDAYGGELYMVFEFINGQGLKEAIVEGGPMPTPRVVHIATQILSSLAEAHRLGLIHRDLKPENIMLTRDNLGQERVKVLDFGIAKLMHEGEGRQEGGNIIVGTPLYMSPEQTLNAPLDPRSDLYSVGVLLFEMLTGRPPFNPPSPLEILRAHREAPPPPIPAHVLVSEALEEVVQRALSKAPEARFDSAEEMASALIEAAAQAPGRKRARVAARASLVMSGPPVMPSAPAPVKAPAAPTARPPIGGGRPPIGGGRVGPPMGWIIAVGIALLIGAVVLFLLPDDPPQPPPPEVVTVDIGDSLEDPLAQARAALKAGRRVEAIGALRRALKIDRDPMALLNRCRQMPDLAPLLNDPSIQAELDKLSP
ncbi:serine/threonine protein kinase [Myxococcota bacterium]|nr:serine/threonine protein kinase [Myxococcota bacterium]